MTMTTTTNDPRTYGGTQYATAALALAAAYLDWCTSSGLNQDAIALEYAGDEEIAENLRQAAAAFLAAAAATRDILAERLR